jgi:hypothetical protein
MDGADERLREALGTQCRALAGQEGDVAAQRQRLQALWEAKRDGWKNLSATAGRGSLKVKEIVGAVRERIGGLFDGSPVALDGEKALADLQAALEGHSATQEALVATLRSSTGELQVLRNLVAMIIMPGSPPFAPNSLFLCAAPAPYAGHSNSEPALEGG